MKQHGGVWLPDDETHLVAWMNKVNKRVDGKLTYQYSKLEAALKYVTQFRTAIDVGAHCGLWAMHLANRFDTVHAFEPVAEHRQCLERNVTHGGHPPNPHNNQVIVHAVAVGDRARSVAMRNGGVSTGDIHVDPTKGGDVKMIALDDLPLLADEPVDFIKLDVEGYELYALRGAEKLLRRCKPVVIVEQKPGRAQKYGLPETGAVAYLQGLGATLRESISGDFILSW